VAAREERVPRSDLETFVSTSRRGRAPRARALAPGGERGGVTRRREFRVEVVRQKYPIMYLAGRPSAVFVPARVPEGGPNRELVSFVILRNPETRVRPRTKISRSSPFPSTTSFCARCRSSISYPGELLAARFHSCPLSGVAEALRGRGRRALVKGGENAFSAEATAALRRGAAAGDALRRSPDFESGLFARARSPTSTRWPGSSRARGVAARLEALPPSTAGALPRSSRARGRPVHPRRPSTTAVPCP